MRTFDMQAFPARTLRNEYGDTAFYFWRESKMPLPRFEYWIRAVLNLPTTTLPVTEAVAEYDKGKRYGR